MTPAMQRIGASLVVLACLRVDGAVAQVHVTEPAQLTVPRTTPTQRTPGPLAQSGRRIVEEAAASATTSVAQSANRPSRNSCVNRLVLSGVVGAGAGLGLGYAWLVKAGGSDSAGAVLRATTILGFGAGLLAGLIACDS